MGAGGRRFKSSRPDHSTYLFSAPVCLPPHRGRRNRKETVNKLALVGRHRKGSRAAKRFFRKALKQQGRAPWQLITYKLRSYAAAHREVSPSVVHRSGQYENNRAEASHQPTRQPERQMMTTDSKQVLNGTVDREKTLCMFGIVKLTDFRGIKQPYRVFRHWLTAHILGLTQLVMC